MLALVMLLSTLYHLVCCCNKTGNEGKKPTCRPCSPERLDHVPVLLLVAFLWQGPAFFCEKILENLVVDCQISIHLLELAFSSSIFDVRGLHTAVLGLPVIKRGYCDA